MPRVRRKQLAAIALTALGVIAAAAVLVLFTGGLRSAGAGAPDPLSAVRHLASAASAEDPAAMLATVDPREASAFAALYADVRSRVRHAGLLRPDGGLAGAQLDIAGLRLREQSLGHGVAKVRIVGGALRARVDATRAPAAVGLRDVSTRVDLATARGPVTYDPHTFAAHGVGLFVMVRERGGRWYVSPALTALQYLVEIDGLPQPDFALLDDPSAVAAPAPRSGDALLRQAAEAASTKDVDRALGLLAPDEADVLRPYRAALDELTSRANGSVSLQIASSHVESRPLAGGLVRLELANVQASASAQSASDYSSAQVSLNGLCIAADGGSARCGGALRRIFGIDRYFVVARRDGSGLRLSVVGTVVAWARAAADHLGDAGLARLLGVLPTDPPPLAAGRAVDGQLDRAGLAVLAYRASGPQYLALDSDRSVELIGPDGHRPLDLACPYGRHLYRLPRAGSYRVALASGAYQGGPYRVSAAPLRLRSAPSAGRLAGRIPRAGGLVAYRVPYSPTSGLAVEFRSTSAVATELNGPLPFETGWCGAPDVLGLQRLLTPDGPAPAQNDVPDGGAAAWSSVEPFQDAGDYLLAVAGAPGTAFSGKLVTRPGY